MRLVNRKRVGASLIQEYYTIYTYYMLFKTVYFCEIFKKKREFYRKIDNNV